MVSLSPKWFVEFGEWFDQYRDETRNPDGTEREDDEPEEAAAPLLATGEEGISFLITQEQKSGLRELGFGDEEIRQMRPDEAHRILGVRPTTAITGLDPAPWSQDAARLRQPAAQAD